MRVEVLEGRQRTLELPVDATVREMMGLNAYMNRDALNRALGDGDLSTGFVLAVERGREAGAAARPRKALPRVAGAFSKATMLRNMQEISARNVRIMSTVLTLFASVIAVGVVYNNARIALAERTWELASLRVLGLHARRGVGAAAGRDGDRASRVALPLGMALGSALVHADHRAAEVRPVLLSGGDPAAHLRLGRRCAVLAAGVASALVVRRRIDRLDMVAALKTRE